MIEIVIIWLRIIAVIVLWEVWKYFAWKLLNWWLEGHVRKHKNSKSKCPYLNGEIDDDE